MQLGYDGAGNAILFAPTITDGAISTPSQGTRVDRERLAGLARLHVASAGAPHEDDRTLH